MRKVVIFGYIYSERERIFLYAAKIEESEKHIIIRENTLQKVKNIFGLEKGDVCKQAGDNRLKILCRANDEYSDEVTYFIKHITGKRKGLTDVIPAETIKEIFYNYTFKEK